MKEKFKTNKGITLIALIITIIVLLILAMISIKLVWNGGIIEHSKNAVNAYNEAQQNEKDQITAAEQEMSKYGNNKTNTEDWYKLTEEEKTELEKAGHISQTLGEKTYEIVKGTALSIGGEEIAPMVLCTEKGLAFAIIPYKDENDARYILFTGEDEKKGEELASMGNGKGGFTTAEKLSWYYMLTGSGGFATFKYIETEENGEYAEYAYNWLNDLNLNKEDIYCPSYYQRLIDNFNK